jgi:hypothetical protein
MTYEMRGDSWIGYDWMGQLDGIEWDMEFNGTVGWDRYEWMGQLDRIQCWVGLNGSWNLMGRLG